MKKSLFICLFICLFSCMVYGQSPEFLRTKKLWHDAALQEITGHPDSSILVLRKVLYSCKPLPYAIGDWYTGTTYFLMARSYARLGDRENTRSSIESAFEHQFRNNELMKLDTMLMSACGHAWFDSLEGTWRIIHQREMKEWKSQSSLVIRPSSLQKNRKLPLMIALHGGNASYEKFAENWKIIADSLNIVIVVPPGNIRVSSITNSWDNDITHDELTLRALYDAMKDDNTIDTNEVYLMGYSQGARVSLMSALQTSLPVKGVIAMSGFCDSLKSSLLSASKKRLKIFAVSGIYDDQTLIMSMKAAQQQCTNARIPFHYEIAQGMLHEMPLDLPFRMNEAWRWLHQLY